MKERVFNMKITIFQNVSDLKGQIKISMLSALWTLSGETLSVCSLPYNSTTAKGSQYRPFKMDTLSGKQQCHYMIASLLEGV